MDFKLNEMQRDIRDVAREYAEKYVAPRVDEIEKADKFPEDLWQIMVDMNLLGIPYPEEVGGIGAGYLATAIALEEIGKVSASAATLLTVCYLPLDALHLYANAEQVEKYLKPGVAGAYRGSFAFTEPETGSDPKQLKTIAEQREDGKWVLNGSKRFISNAAYNGPIIIFAKEKETEQCTAFIVEKFCKGYTLSKPYEKVSVQGSNIYDVFLDDVVVDECDILGARGQGFDILIGTTAYGKLAFSAVFTGTMGGSFEMAVKYAREKMHRDKPIAKFPTVQSRIAQIGANVMAAKLCLYKAASDADEYQGDIRRIQCSTALIKGYISDLAVETNVMCLNVHGAYGVCGDFPIERMVRDSLVAPNIEGAADIQRIIAGGYITRSDKSYFDWD
ncbi:MAG: acyl-CoA/acyl-ACP dehydrogenase [Firmicutes bacterium]|nr:acyl-CoA/acyl-ACP dehydrogenase [Bacillota bacterium]